MADVNVCIVGSGIVGACVAARLSKAFEDIVVLDRNPGVAGGENQTSRNSGVLHSGIIYERSFRPLKAALSVSGIGLWYDFCRREDLPCIRTGKLMVAVNAEQEAWLDTYLRRAAENGVPNVRKISGSEVRELEPNVAALSALLIPSAGIVDPIELVRRKSLIAERAGVKFIPSATVTGLAITQSEVEITLRYRDGAEDAFTAELLINAAGTGAVGLARLLDPDFSLRAALVRGDSMKFYGSRRPELRLSGMNVYPTPLVVNTASGPQHTVGVHLTPTLDCANHKPVIGNVVTVGPKLLSVSHADDYVTPGPPPADYLRDLAFFPGLRESDLEPHQSGVQARLVGFPDFHIAWDRVNPSVIHLVGIDSPGLTSAPAIAERVFDMLAGARLRKE